MKEKYGFPLCIQLAPPEDILQNSAFARILDLLQKKKFYGVELNISAFDKIDPTMLKEYLSSYNLKMTYLASGVFAQKNGLSLSSANETIRRKTVDSFETMVSFAEKMGSGIICGYIKGMAGENHAEASEQLERSVEELRNRYKGSKTAILLEATNHYEATMLNTLSEAASYIKEGETNFQILPDTYHMNIEESSTAEALIRYSSYYQNVHVSDNNRYYPGFGAIDFFQIIRILMGVDYQGVISIEGRNLWKLEEDIKKTADYLSSLGKRL